MTPKNTEPGDAAELRRRAEEQARNMESASMSALSHEESRRLVHELQVHQLELEMQNEELRTAQAEIEAGRDRYYDLYDLAPVGYCTLSEKEVILETNLTVATLLGTPRGALVKQTISHFILKEDQDIYYLHRKQLFETGATQDCELRLVKPDGTLIWVHLTATASQAEDGAPVCRVVLTDITEHKRAETYREMGLEILDVLNEPGGLQESIPRILDVLKTRTGFDAVGLRLQEGEDFPYFAQDGFPPDFLRTENTLVERGQDGGVCRDKDGKVCLECTCGLVISGKTDPANPLFTQGGSSWTNDSFPLLDLPPDQDPRLHPRNNCIHQGYASVALIPVRTKDRIVGLIQLNDKRKGRFTLETIEILESIAAHIGSAMIRKQAEAALRERINELDCLRRTGEILADRSLSLREVLDRVVKLLPPAWMHSDAACARIVLDDIRVATDDDTTPSAVQRANIIVDGRQAGMIEVGYRGRQAPADEGPFQKEERELLDTLAELLGRHVEQIGRLSQSEIRFKQLLTLAPLPMAHVNKDGQLIYINNRFTELFGYDLDDVPDLDAWWEAAYPDPEYRAQVLKTWTADFETAAQQGTDIQAREYRLRCKDGSVRVVEVGGVVVGDEFMGIFIDRTERDRAARTLRESEQRFRDIFDTAPVSIWQEDWSAIISMVRGCTEQQVADFPAYLGSHPDFVSRALREVKVIDVNAATMDMFGARDKGDLLNSLETVFATPDTQPGFVGELCALAEGRQFYKTEMRLCTVSGDRIHVLLTMAFPAPDSDSGMVLVSLMDMSERKRQEEEQQRLTRELARKNRELSQVVYVASHDLRSPLVNVQGFSRELKASTEELSEAMESVTLPSDVEKKVRYLLDDDIPGSLDYILNSVSQMDRLLAGLLKISRLGRATLTVADIDANKLVAGVVESLDFQLREMGAQVDIDDLPPCRGDAGQLEQVFANLLGNAVKYAAPDRGLHVHVSGRRTSTESIYCVQDNGCGIAPEHQEKIFELFHRLSPHGSEGEGLGLTSVRTILDRHRGRIWVESEPGRGSSFYISLPLVTGDDRLDLSAYEKRTV